MPWTWRHSRDGADPTPSTSQGRPDEGETLDDLLRRKGVRDPALETPSVAGEFIEDVTPLEGLPSLTAEYGLPPLPDASPADRHAEAVKRARRSAAWALVAVSKRLGEDPPASVVAAATGGSAP